MGYNNRIIKSAWVCLFHASFICVCPAGLSNTSDITSWPWSTQQVRTLESTSATQCSAKTKTAGRSTTKQPKSSSFFLVWLIHFIDSYLYWSWNEGLLLPSVKYFQWPYQQSASSFNVINQTHRNYLFLRLTTMRWFSWEATGRQSSHARWHHQKHKWLYTVSSHPHRWQWMRQRSPLTWRRASPSIDPGPSMPGSCTVWPVWAAWGRVPSSTYSSMLTVSHFTSGTFTWVLKRQGSTWSDGSDLLKWLVQAQGVYLSYAG